MLGSLTPGGFAPGGSFSSGEGTLPRIDLPTFVTLDPRLTRTTIDPRVSRHVLDPQTTRVVVDG